MEQRRCGGVGGQWEMGGLWLGYDDETYQSGYHPRIPATEKGNCG